MRILNLYSNFHYDPIEPSYKPFCLHHFLGRLTTLFLDLFSSHSKSEKISRILMTSSFQWYMYSVSPELYDYSDKGSTRRTELNFFYKFDHR